MTERSDKERFVYLYVLVSSVLLVVIALTDPANGLLRKLYDIGLATSLMVVSAWQLLKLRKH